MTIDAAALHEQLAAGGGPRMLDVRTAAEFETAHIPGAYNVPLDLLREHRAELRAHLDEDIVLVCQSGARAGQAERSLAEAGLPNVKVLNGGMLAWQGIDGQVNRGNPRWSLERQIRLLAGGIVALSVVGSLLLPGLQWIAALVGTGLAVAALTNTCAMGMLLAKLPYNRGAGCDLDTIIEQLRDSAPVRGLRT
jgi:rhodanese-related sulfurtransferase